MSDKNHLGQTNTVAAQDRWSGEIFGLKSAENGWSGKNLIGQAKSQILSDQMSCQVSATFVNTAKAYKKIPVFPMTLEKNTVSRSEEVFPFFFSSKNPTKR